MMQSLRPAPRTNHEAPDDARAPSEQSVILKQFAGAVAHELNNVLTATIGNLSLLQDTGFDDGDMATVLVAETMAAVRRGVDLSEKLEAFAERLRLEPAPFDMNRLVIGVVSGVRSALESAEVQLALPPVAPIAFVDGSKLTAALADLALNIARSFERGVDIFRLEIGMIGNSPEEKLSHHSGPRICARIRCTGAGLHPDFVKNAVRAPYAGASASRHAGWDLASIDGFIRQSSGHLAVGVCTENEINLALYLPAES